MGHVVNLRWIKHQQELVQGIWNLFKEKYKTDFEVSLNGNYISAHQMIMSVFCPTIKNASNNTLILGEKALASKEDLDSVIEFLYRGEVRVETNRLCAMMNLSDQLGFKVLSQLIAQSLKVIERKSPNFSKQAENEPAVVKGNERKSRLRIMPDRKTKKQLMSRCSASRTEIIKPPKNTVVSQNNEPNFNKRPSKLSVKETDKVVEEPNLASSNSDILTSAAESTATDDDDANNSVQKPLNVEPQRRDDLYLESFNPQTFEFICKHCSKGFTKANELNNHLHVHEQPKILFECQHCDYKANKRTNFWGHMVNRHQMDLKGNLLPKNLKCPDCSYVCSAKFQLNHHIYHVHAEKRNVCESCGYRCPSKAGLEKHKQLVHSNAKPLMCETCGYQAKVFANLRRHMRVHFCNKVICDICGASVSANHLHAHKKIHSSSPKPFTCSLCNFSSWKNWNLKVHLRSVHQVEPNNQQMDIETDLI